MLMGSEVMSDYVFTRFRVKLTLQDVQQLRGDKAAMRAAQVRDEIQGFLDACSLVDPSIALVPWSEKDKTLPCKLPKPPPNTSIPTHFDQSKKYFHSINPYAPQPDMWFYMRLRHEVSASTIVNNVERSFRLTIWVARLQLGEAPIKGGFFVYSHRNFSSSSSLISSIRSAIMAVVDRELELAFFWERVNMFKINIQGPFSLQIEVDQKEYDFLKRALTVIYNTRKSYPLGVPMVYVPPVNRCLDDDLLRQACDSQVRFQMVAASFEFRCFLSTDLGFKVKLKSGRDKAATLGEVFRKFIKQGESPVFHSVIECSDSSGSKYIHALVMPSSKRLRLARAIFQSPVAVFRHYLDESYLSRLFDTLSMLQSESDIYDADTETVTNNDESRAMEALRTCITVDMSMVLESQAEGQRSRQGDAASYAASYASNFSFDPGSVRTNSNSAQSKKARFSQTQVPGTPKGVSGEGS